MHARKFNHNGREYEVRAARNGDEWNIAIFEAGVQRTDASIVSEEVRTDAERVAALNLIRQAMDIVQSEFERGTAFEIDMAIRELGKPKQPN